MTKRWALEETRAKVEWEGADYFMDDVNPDRMPTQELTVLLRQAQSAYREFWDALEAEGDENDG
jgi:hypothetical protein